MIGLKAVVVMSKRDINLPTVKELAVSADAGVFDDSLESFLPDSFYTRGSAPDAVRRVLPRKTRRTPRAVSSKVAAAQESRTA
jgi:hypothetical protein